VRQRDTVAVELVAPPGNAARAPGAGAVFDRFTSLQIVNDITAPSEALFEVGDDGTWSALSEYVAHGARYSVRVNGLLRLTGRVEASDVPSDPKAGAVVRFTVRTKLQDALYESADESVRVKNVSLKDFILAVYAPLGYVESDFIFRGSVARDLITGRDSANKGSQDARDLEPIKLDQAKVRPPESVYDAADRHLRRHGLMHWDSPDGRIVVSAPNDTQPPLYTLVQTRSGRGLANNTLGITRTQDWSSIPTAVWLYGVAAGGARSRSRVSAYSEDADLLAAGFHRPITILAEGVKTRELADRAAARELSARSRAKDSLSAEVDGLSWWSGSESIPWGVDTVADVLVDQAGGRCGAYYLHRVQLRRDAQRGDVTNLSMVRKGVWQL